MTTILSTIPTAIKYIRSPYTISSSYAYYIELDGGVYGDYHGAYYSYGLSPDNDWIARDDYVLYVDLDGSLGDVYDVERSYGICIRSPGTNMSSRTFHSDPIGDVWYDSAGAGGVASYGK